MIPAVDVLEAYLSEVSRANLGIADRIVNNRVELYRGVKPRDQRAEPNEGLCRGTVRSRSL